ncbi:shieldin complex subunit 2 isoform X2 [Callorhinchus milii]|uniref:shieldin complex subunit 2 isoform X2 n=1 Tax=Callorhinchus milii TaxID=7868 RepID=UPI001C3F9F06|nr:shieldin complex subunit 2 isoform X2 [Callorhinchus milii]
MASNRKTVHIFLGAPVIPAKQQSSAQNITGDSLEKWHQCHVRYDKESLTIAPRDCGAKDFGQHLNGHEGMLLKDNEESSIVGYRSGVGYGTTSKEWSFQICGPTWQKQGGNIQSSTRQMGDQHHRALNNQEHSERDFKIIEEHKMNPTRTGERFERSAGWYHQLINRQNIQGSRGSGKLLQPVATEEMDEDHPDSTNRIEEQNAILPQDSSLVDCSKLLQASLVEYLQSSFPEEAKAPTSCAESLSMLPARQGAILSQKCSNNHLNTQGARGNEPSQMEKNMKPAEVSRQPFASKHSPDMLSRSCAIESECRLIDISDNTAELFSSLSEQKPLPTDEMICRHERISEGSELLFSPFNDWSKGNSEVNIELYSGGILCSQISNSAQQSFKRSRVADNEREELCHTLIKPSVYALKELPASKRMKENDSERISDLGHYLKAKQDTQQTSRVGYVKTERLGNCTDGDVTLYRDHWRGEEMLQATQRSKMINLGPCLLVQPAQWSHTVSAAALEELIVWITGQKSYLLSMGSRNHQHLASKQYASLDKLHPDVVVHALLRVVLITVLSETAYLYGGKEQQKVLLEVEQVKGQQAPLILWGNSISWRAQIQKKQDHVWSFRNLLVCQNAITGDLELHSTPWSSCECLFDDDERAIEYMTKYHSGETASVKTMALSTLLSTRYSGDIQFKAHIVGIQWNGSCTRSSLFNMDALTPLETVLSSLSHFTYSGCGKCGSELGLDDNNVYQQCIPCLPYNTVQIYYRPTTLVVTDEDSMIDVHVSSKIMEKIFHHIPPGRLCKVQGPSEKVSYGMVIAELCCSLFGDSNDRCLLTVQSQFDLDENSVSMKQDFYLLDFHPNV